MTRSLFIAALVAAGTAVAATQGAQTPAAGGQAPQAPVFRSQSDTVPVYVTVTDKSDRFVTDLTRADFALKDSGKPQEVTLFDNSPQPVRLIVLLDVSGSMNGNLPLLRGGCDALLRAMQPQDRVRFGTFGKEVTITPEFSDDGEALMRSLPTEIDPTAPTPLWRAANEALDDFAKVDDGRRVILILSDGRDSPGFTLKKNYSQAEIIDRAQRDGVMVYGIGLRGHSAAANAMGMSLGDAMAADLPDPGLGTAAVATGGGYFELRGRDDLRATFARVADELHSQYLLGFVPHQFDGKEHKLEVGVTKTGDFKPRFRKSYVAPKH